MAITSRKIININENPEEALILAAGLFHSGKIFIYPTDTIYGIGGNPFNPDVVKRISEIKGRDEKKQFIWLISDLENLLNYVEVSNEAYYEFLEKIWPAPVSVILKLNERTSKIVNQNSVAVRIPDNYFCLKLLKEISRPLISTSVNRSGEVPLILPEVIIDKFLHEVDAILFHTESANEKSSTIIDLTTNKPKLVREGSIKFVELLQNLT
ncbi:MAG: threonylcarbamoyl-AMP synthase [bacterium]|nr:threonylcarbamoyl-AMP synthase [bacterium]